MSHPLSRRRFLQASAACAAVAVAGAEGTGQPAPGPGGLVINDDGHVFLNLNDGLGKAELRRYLESYCRPGVGTVAYCVGDMSWPTLYPTRVGVHYSVLGAGGDLRRSRAHRNLDRFASEPGGYFGAAFAILRELGKKVLASFRMNDAHFTSLDNPNVSEFWKQHAKRALGPAYGYYGGCLDYASDVVREVRYAANGRDTRIHTVKLGPYLEYEVSLRPSQLSKGENVLEVTPTRLTADLLGKINLVEIELQVIYAEA